MDCLPLTLLTSRRAFVTSIAGVAGSVLLAACGGDKQSIPGSIPNISPKPLSPIFVPTPSGLKAVPRNRTLMLMWAGYQGRYQDFDLWNLYAIGSNHQNGGNLIFEPLAYYRAFADKEIPWLAESYEYSADFKQLTIKIRAGVSWSDGVPFTAEDVAYTLTSLRDLGSKVIYGVDVQKFVDTVIATTPNTVVIQFKFPAPRFFESLLTYKYDIGLFIVPKHIYESKDWTTFKNFDPAMGQPVTTGPWHVVVGSPEQKILDRREDWWAAKAGLATLPKVERIVYLPFSSEIQTAQAAIANQIDASVDFRPNTMKAVLAQNSKIVSHTGAKSPYGYQDWWPTSLYLNCSKPPFDDPDVRWALSYFIDRNQVIDVAYGGASAPSSLPMPQYPSLQQYFDGVKDLLERYPTTKTDVKMGSDLLTRKGWRKGSDGIWADRSGHRLKLEILGLDIFADIGPVIAQQLRINGVDANYAMPSNAIDRFVNGDFSGSLYGHGGSVRDPYETLSLYQSSSMAVPGQHQVNFSRWVNPAFDAVVDQVYGTAMENKVKLQELFHRAMEIWLPQLPDIQITKWFLRIPMNTTYWSGWPTEDKAYVNGAFWHLTFQLILNNLKPVD